MKENCIDGFRLIREKVQEALGREGTRRTHCALDADAGASTSRRADAVLVLTPPAAFENVSYFVVLFTFGCVFNIC